MYRLNSGIRNRHNAHAKVRNWIFDVQFSGKRSELTLKVSFQMIFEALQSELFRFMFHSLGSKILKTPEFKLFINQVIFTKNFVFISSWSSFSQPINFFLLTSLLEQLGAQRSNFLPWSGQSFSFEPLSNALSDYLTVHSFLFDYF